MAFTEKELRIRFRFIEEDLIKAKRQGDAQRINSVEMNLKAMRGALEQVKSEKPVEGFYEGIRLEC